jgi:hypothetical protein
MPGDWLYYKSEVVYKRGTGQLTEDGEGECGITGCGFEVWDNVDDQIIHNAATQYDTIRNLANYGGVDKHP